MPKFTPLMERVRVATETRNADEIRNIKQEILDAFKASGEDLAHTAKEHLEVNPMTLRRVAKILRLEKRLRIDLERGRGLGRWSELGRRIADAQERGDAKSLQTIRSEILCAFCECEGNIDATAARFDVAPRKLREFAQVLGIEKDLGIEATAAGSPLLLSRARVAVDRGDKRELATLRKKALAEIKTAGGNLRMASGALGVSSWGLRQLLDLLGMTEEIEQKFPGQGKPRHLTVNIAGRETTHTIAEWARINGVNRTTIIERLRRGYTPEQAIAAKDFREG
jgi:hypothetical protein